MGTFKKALIVHTMECYEPDLSDCSEYVGARSKGQVLKQVVLAFGKVSY